MRDIELKHFRDSFENKSNSQKEIIDLLIADNAKLEKKVEELKSDINNIENKMLEELSDIEDINTTNIDEFKKTVVILARKLKRLEEENDELNEKISINPDKEDIYNLKRQRDRLIEENNELNRKLALSQGYVTKKVKKHVYNALKELDSKLDEYKKLHENRK